MTAASYSPLRLIGLGMSAMLVPLSSTMIVVALPAMGAEFARTPGELTLWLVNSYLLMNIVALGPGGKLGDHWGYKNTLRLGQGMFGLGCMLPILFHQFEAVVASRILMALGGAMMVPNVMAVFKITVPEEKRHRVFGYFSGMMGFAAALGPSLGGLLVQHFGWGAIFLMNLPPLALSIFFSVGFFRNSLHEPPPQAFRFDWAGTVLLAAGLLCLVIGLKERHLLLLLASVLLIAIFAWWQSRTAHPLINLALFADRSFSAGCVMIALLNLGMYALLFQLPYLLNLFYQWGPEQTGHYMTTFMVSMMVSSMAGGRVAEKVGVRATCAAGALTAVGGLVWMSLVAPGWAPWHVAAGLVLAGLGVGLANGPSQSAAMATVERAMSGVASGVMSTFRYIGGVVGISVLALLLTAPTAAQSLVNHRQALMVFALSFLIAALVSLFLPGRARAG